jgi:acyl-coenzyme A synthetase/AMP-(fatty) acid ligase
MLFEDRWYDWSTFNVLAQAVIAALESWPRDLAVAQITRNRPASAAALLGLVADQRCVLQISSIQPPMSLAQEVLRLRPAIVVAERDDWTEALNEAAATVGALGLCLDADAVSSFSKWICSDAEHFRAPPDTAIMMPTSGTTGPPKRIPITVAQLETYRADREQSGGDTRRAIIVAAPIFTITGLRPMLAWATRPLRMALLERIDVVRWAALVAQYRPREGGLPPAAMRMLLDSDVPRESLASLQCWNTGSAPLDPDLAERFEARFGVPVLVAYGATEFGGPVTRMTLDDRNTWGTTKRGSSGRAIAGNQLRVVSQEDGTELPPGKTGLLEVAAARTGGKFVRTNDLARLDEDGFLYIEGRADDVIIRGGFKVPLREVEAVLESHPLIRQAAVLGEEDERLGQVPVAAIVLREEARQITQESIEQWARDQMAPYKRPVRFTILNELPMTASMKINRPELRRLMASATPLARRR